MGKPTGFIEYERQTGDAETPKSRIRHFNEFHTYLPEEKAETAGSALYGVRRSLLPGGNESLRDDQRLSAPQSGAGVERSGLHRELGAGLQQAHKDQQLSGVYIQGLPRPVRGGLHLQSCGRAGSHEGKRICHH